MKTYRKASNLRSGLAAWRASGRSLGFVPTMGALHAGHLALVRRAQAENDRVVCSIFVNPTQFNDAGDLDAYPRTPDTDAAVLSEVSTDVLFLPPAEEIYPPGEDLRVPVDFGALPELMEGAFRPGHFEGVAMVVRRLLDLVAPDRLYLGEKDFQQLAIIRHMVDALGLPVRVVGCPTVREADGLAMSSRNLRLSPEDRRRAPILYQTLRWAREQAGRLPAPEIGARAEERVRAGGLRPEYFLIVDPRTLRPLPPDADPRPGRACTAAWAGDVRLIDNMPMADGAQPPPASSG